MAEAKLTNAFYVGPQRFPAGTKIVKAQNAVVLLFSENQLRGEALAEVYQLRERLPDNLSKKIAALLRKLPAHS